MAVTATFSTHLLFVQSDSDVIAEVSLFALDLQVRLEVINELFADDQVVVKSNTKVHVERRDLLGLADLRFLISHLYILVGWLTRLKEV